MIRAIVVRPIQIVIIWIVFQRVITFVGVNLFPYPPNFLRSIQITIAGKEMYEVCKMMQDHDRPTQD